MLAKVLFTFGRWMESTKRTDDGQNRRVENQAGSGFPIMHLAGEQNLFYS
jgi:hypothetical protein